MKIARFLFAIETQWQYFNTSQELLIMMVAKWFYHFYIYFPIMLDIIFVICRQSISDFSRFSFLIPHFSFSWVFTCLLLIPMDKKCFRFHFKCQIRLSYCTAYDWKTQASQFKNISLEGKSRFKALWNTKAQQELQVLWSTCSIFCSLMSVFFYILLICYVFCPFIFC